MQKQRLTFTPTTVTLRIKQPRIKSFKHDEKLKQKHVRN